MLAGVVAVAGCSSAAPSLSPTTGLTGVVLRGPIAPVCRVDIPCDAPFGAHFTVERAGRSIAAFQSDPVGQFTVLLEPGTYIVRPAADAPLVAPASQLRTVTVGDDGLTAVRLMFDTGIR